MNQNPLWKILLLVLVVAIGALFALPNLYGEDPALQISADRGAELNQAVLDDVVASLTAAGLTPTSAKLVGERAEIRFAHTEDQLKAREQAEAKLGSKYIVALNLAAAAPQWLRDMGALPMYLGLDLRGGVHFLMEVDMDDVVKRNEKRLLGELRTELRKQKLRYRSLSQDPQLGVVAVFRDADGMERAREVVRDNFPDFQIVQRDDEFTLLLNETEAAIKAAKSFALQQNITTLRNRVNELGVAEPVIQQQGDSRIVVQLPGIQDPARAKDILGATATLEFRLVSASGDPFAAQESGNAPVNTELYLHRDGTPILVEKKIIVTGEHITNAASGIDPQSGTPSVNINLDGSGGRLMSHATRGKIGRNMAVIFIENKITSKRVDGEIVKTKRTIKEIINAATIRDELAHRFQITGLDSTEEAHDLALLLRAGSLAAPIEIIEERTVGPSLGQDNIDQGFRAVIIGFALVLVFMAVYYRLFGVIANLALTLNLVLIVAVLSMFQATLTLPGIAGIVLTVGMAVDANVLIFQRIREELKIGNSPQASIHAGYEKAFSTIADANVTTLIAAIILFGFGTGPIKGFAITLCIGIATSMFTAIMGTRVIVNAIYGGRRVEKLSI